MATTDFPLYTARHSQHSAVWTVPGFSIHRFYIACATERLESADELGVHVKKVLNEFQALLSATNEKGTFVKTITSNTKITEHLRACSVSECVYRIEFLMYSCKYSHSAVLLILLLMYAGLLSRPDSSDVLLTVQGW